MKVMVTKFFKRLGGNLRACFFAGILVIMPISLTIWIFTWIFNNVDGFLSPYIEQVFNRSLPGIGFAVTILIVYLAGVLGRNILGRRLIQYGERVLGRIPIAGYLYNGIRQIIQSFTAPDNTGFMQVVLVKFPHKDTHTIGFITNESPYESGRRLLNVFIPTSPNPTSGFLQIIDEEEVIRTNISVDDALKMVVSGGRISHREISERLGVGSEPRATTQR